MDVRYIQERESRIEVLANQMMQGQQTVKKEDRKPFYLYIDEFQNFITTSLEDILSGARKYGLGLVMADQYMLQVEKQSKEIAESIMANAGTRICFGLSERDANMLKGFPISMQKT